MPDSYPRTAEQREQLARLWRYIARTDLRRIMNDTKWREVMQVLRSLPADFPVWFRAQMVMDPDREAHWESDFPWHFPGHYQFIEWADFRTVVTMRHPSGEKEVISDRTDEILGGLRSHNIPYTFSRDVPWGFAGGVVRIWGYLRPSATVVFDDQGPEVSETYFETDEIRNPSQRASKAREK
jgi:hypothetical protein